MRNKAELFLFEQKAVLIVSAELHHSTQSGFEQGAIIGERGAVVGPFTEYRPDRVDPKLRLDLSGPEVRVDGTDQRPLASMHAHLPAGEYAIRGSARTFTATVPLSPSSGDVEFAKKIPGYILVPSQKVLIKVSRDGTHKGHSLGEGL